MLALHSYAFRLTATSRQDTQAQVLVAVGRTQAPDRILATVSQGGRTERVLASEKGQFVAEATGPWLPVTGTTLQPINWASLLDGTTRPTLTSNGVITADLQQSQARTIGLPTGATLQAARLTLATNPRRQATRLDITVTGQLRQQIVQVTENVTLSGYDKQPPIPPQPRTQPHPSAAAKA
jgi:hypothetical protein